jgi:HEAT repeat protein
VREALAAARAEVASEAPPLPEPDADLRERMAGLVELLASSQPAGEMASIAREDAGAGPACGAPVLAQALTDYARPPRERRAAAELLASLARAFPAAGPRACAALAEAQGNDPTPDLRLAGARLLGDLGASSADGAGLALRAAARAQLPRLLLRLKYEENNSAVIALAVALARLGNGTGIEVLLQLEAGPAAAELAGELRHARRAVVAALAGTTLAEARAAWDAGELDQAAPAPGLRLAAWESIAALRGERIQLRGVDDARFVLARLGPWAARLLARALSDGDLYVRVHAAQCLGRMGPRGGPGREALLASLADPALAPQAAEALGAVGGPGVGAALLALTGAGQEAELRSACVRALGELGEPAAAAPLTALFGADQSPALAVVIATALVQLESAGPPVLDYLAGELVSERGPLAEAALDSWMRAAAEPGLAAAWAAADPGANRSGEPAAIPTLEEARERRRKRAALWARRAE